MRRARISAHRSGAALAPCALSLQDDLLPPAMFDPKSLNCVAQSRRLIDEHGKPLDMSAPAAGYALPAGVRLSNPDKDTPRL